MKPLHFTVSILSLFILLTSSECKKPKNDLPPDNPYGLPNATKEGKMVFACRMNGKNWISDKDIFHLGGGYKNDTLGISGSPETDGYFESLSLNLFGSIQQGREYDLNKTAISIARYRTNKTCLGYSGSNITHANSISGKLFLSKLDTANKILSGTFFCTIPISGCDTLHITDGRFDIRYY